MVELEDKIMHLPLLNPVDSIQQLGKQKTNQEKKKKKTTNQTKPNDTKQKYYSLVPLGHCGRIWVWIQLLLFVVYSGKLLNFSGSDFPHGKMDIILVFPHRVGSLANKWGQSILGPSVQCLPAPRAQTGEVGDGWRAPFPALPRPRPMAPHNGRLLRSAL